MNARDQIAARQADTLALGIRWETISAEMFKRSIYFDKQTLCFFYKRWICLYLLKKTHYTDLNRAIL